MSVSTSSYPLITFLEETMSMTDLYQPTVIKALLENDGVRTKSELAAMLAQYDTSVQEYYEKIVMRWPRITLTKHNIINYERQDQAFRLVCYPDDERVRKEALTICKHKIAEWLDKKGRKSKNGEPNASIRYRVLKDAQGKCALCGIPSSLRPIDLDHIVPRSKANKHGQVRKDGCWIDVNDRDNLQALCMTCNRAKRASDETDFRPRAKLVRDKVPELICADGHTPETRNVSGVTLKNALSEKLLEEHSEFIAAGSDASGRLEELADMTEVILALAAEQGVTEAEFFDIVRQKRAKKGGFKEGVILSVRSR